MNLLFPDSFSFLERITSTTIEEKQTQAKGSQLLALVKEKMLADPEKKISHFLLSNNILDERWYVNTWTLKETQLTVFGDFFEKVMHRAFLERAKLDSWPCLLGKVILLSQGDHHPLLSLIDKKLIKEMDDTETWQEFSKLILNMIKKIVEIKEQGNNPSTSQRKLLTLLGLVKGYMEASNKYFEKEQQFSDESLKEVSQLGDQLAALIV